MRLNDEKPGAFTLQWPPPGLPLPTVSPAAESDQRYGPLRASTSPRSGLPIALGTRDSGVHAHHVLLKWREPLKALLPLGGTLDEIHALTQMARIARQRQEHPDAALREAVEASARYVYEGHTIDGFAWVGPTLLEQGPTGVLGRMYSRYGLWYESLEELLNSAEAWDVIKRRVPIRRAWGAVGLFWMLLQQEIKARTLQRCERCGRFLHGGRQKRYCDRKDDPVCYRGRKRDYEYQRRSTR
jgi:hypothetical protein